MSDFTAPSGRKYKWKQARPITQGDVNKIVAFENSLVKKERAKGFKPGELYDSGGRERPTASMARNAMAAVGFAGGPVLQKALGTPVKASGPRQHKSLPKGALKPADPLGDAYRKLKGKPLDPQERKRLMTTPSMGSVKGVKTLADELIRLSEPDPYRGENTVRNAAETTRKWAKGHADAVSEFAGDVFAESALAGPRGVAKEELRTVGKFGADALNPLRTVEQIAAGDPLAFATAPFQAVGTYQILRGALSRVFGKEIAETVAETAVKQTAKKAPPVTAKTPVKPVKKPSAQEPMVDKKAEQVAAIIGGKVPKETPKPKQTVKALGRQVDDTKATGLANQVQEREAIDGVLKEVESAGGKGAEHWQKVGRQKVDEGEDYEALADRVMRGEEELTGEKVGILLEGKRLLMNDVDRIKAALDKTPGDGKLLEKYAEARERLDTYVQSVQAGKGRWSDVGRALQAGTKLNEGSFAEVLQEAKRGGKVSARLERELEKTTARVAERDAKIAELEKQLAETPIQALTKKGARKANKQTIQEEIDSIWEEFHSVRAGGGGQSRTRGMAAVPTGEDWKVAARRVQLIGRLVKSYAKLGVTNLEDIVVNVQTAIKEKLGFDVSRQEIIDEFAATQPRTKSELQKTLEQLKREAKKASTEAQQQKAVTQAQKKAASDLRAQIKRSQQAAKQLDDLEKQSEKLASREAIKQAREAKRLEDAKLREMKRIAEKEFGEQWQYQEKVFKTEEEIADLKRQLDSGMFRVKGGKELQIEKDLQNLRAERDLYAGKVRSAIRQNEKSWGRRATEETFGAIRTVILGSDIGTLTRQGLFAWSPQRIGGAVKGLGNAAKSMFSPKNFAKWEREQAERVVAGKKMILVEKKAGLSVTDTLNHQEEIVATKLFRKLFGDKIGGSLERAQIAFINTVRRDSFDWAVRRGMTDDELKLRAQFINNATGRGNIKNVPILAQAILTSPRYEASRWAMIWEGARNPAIAIASGGKNKAAVANTLDMAATAAEVYGVFKLAEMSGYSVNWDPSSGDFLKLRRGNEVWDVSAGVAPRLRDAIRLYIYASDPSNKENLARVIEDMATRPFSPSVKTPVELYSFKKQRDAGKTKLRSPFSGFEEDGATDLWRFAPLIIQGMKKNIEEGNEAVTPALREFVGQSVNQYKK